MTIVKLLIGVAAASFVVGVVTVFTGPILTVVTAEAFSRATNNLALLAIALLLLARKETKV